MRCCLVDQDASNLGRTLRQTQSCDEYSTARTPSCDHSKPILEICLQRVKPANQIFLRGS